jgi:hypothetical protein
MKALICLVVSLIILANHASGQTESSRKFEISFIPALSIPIASYGRKDPARSAILTDPASPYSIQGFNKSKSGFAKIGLDYSFEVKYKLNGGFRLLFRTGVFSNSVETNRMSEFVTQSYLNRNTKVEEDDYWYLYITPGVGYYKSFGKYNFGFDLLAGYSLTEYPYYKFVLLFTTVYPPIILAHDGPRPDLNSIIVGSSVSMSYRIINQFEVGLVVSYLHSNFSYKYIPRFIPGGSQVLEYSEVLKMRVLTAGIRLSYNL